MKKGFSALESLIALTLFLFIVLAVFEFFGLTRDFFIKLKKAEEETQAIMASLDKMRIDLLHAGRGLAQPIRLGIVEGVIAGQSSLLITSCEKSYALLEGLSAGATSIVLESTAGLRPGQEICLFDRQKGECKFISACQGTTIFLSSPLESSYQENETVLVLLERISLYIDEESGVLRRKVNASSPQPLCEDLSLFKFAFERESNLAKLSLALKTHEERIHELWIFPKNTGLCRKAI